MIVVLKPGVCEEKKSQLTDWLAGQGLSVHPALGGSQTILGLVGDTSRLDTSLLESLEIVDSVKPVSDPFKCCNRKFHPDDTVISVGEAKFGGGHFSMIAGPCSVESEEQIVAVAQSVKAAGAQVLRGGAFKPRTSPYDFQGLHELGLRFLETAKRETGLPIVTELMNSKHLPLFDNVDIIQIGARNMQNYDLLRALGRSEKPVLLKRGIGATLQELLLSAEYLLAAGNPRVMLCERGIRTFDTFTRGTLDLAAVPALHEMTHLPVLADPSHAAGRAALVTPLALAAAACGADGVMVEMHPDPLHARCDGAQALLPEELAALSQRLHAVREACR